MPRLTRVAALSAALWVGSVVAVVAQVPEQAGLDSLRAALARMSARLDSVESGFCPAPGVLLLPTISPGDPRTDSLAAAVRSLGDRMARLAAARCRGQQAAPMVQDSVADDLAALRAAAAAAAAGEPAAPGAPPPAKRDTTPAQPTEFVGRQRNASALNPEISATGDIRLFARDQGVPGIGASAREFEVAIQSALDPYSNAKIVLTFGEEGVGVEEGYLYWTGLPGRLRLDVGEFRQQIGDLNRWHLHALPETEYPLVYQRFFGDEGLKGAGISLYTALPLSIAGGTHEVWLQGTTTVDAPFIAASRRPVVLGRLQNFWQLSRSTYAQIGFTGIGGENRDSALTGRVFGLDFRLTWRPPSAGTRRDFTLRAEGYQLHTRTAGVSLNRYGGFVDATYKASRRWLFGARYDRVESPRGLADTEWRLTPTITWWQSEFVFLRLEGEHRQSDSAGKASQLALQVVFAMGPHKHETY